MEVQAGAAGHIQTCESWEYFFLRDTEGGFFTPQISASPMFELPVCEDAWRLCMDYAAYDSLPSARSGDTVPSLPSNRRTGSRLVMPPQPFKHSVSMLPQPSHRARTPELPTSV